MQYTVIFIAVLIVMVLMNGYLVFILKNLISDINTQLRGHFVDHLSIYDELYEQKAERLMQIREEEERRAANLVRRKEPEKEEASVIPVVHDAACDIPAGSYIQSDFASDYQYIRSNFQVDKDDVIQKLDAEEWSAEKSSSTDKKRSAAIKLIAEQLTPEVMFRLGQMSSEDQEEVIREALEDPGILDEYLSQKRRMDIWSFYDYIKQQQLFYDTTPIVVEADGRNGMYEGFQIIRGQKLYDYSIRQAGGERGSK